MYLSDSILNWREYIKPEIERQITQLTPTQNLSTILESAHDLW